MINHSLNLVFYHFATYYFDFNYSKVTNYNAFISVDSNFTSGALSFKKASFHLNAHKHQKSPYFSPGKLYSFFGVIKSFP